MFRVRSKLDVKGMMCRAKEETEKILKIHLGSQRVNHASLFIFIIKDTDRQSLIRDLHRRSRVKVTDSVLANRYLNHSRLSSLRPFVETRTNDSAANRSAR